MVPYSAQPIYRFYEALSATLPVDPLAGLGGKLFYAGAIDSQIRNLLYAANIGGAASLATSGDPAALRTAMRDGVIDFAVNSLEEALRILKNEIRKRQTVAVGVAAEPSRLVEQMLDRGVLPDLLPPESGDFQNPDRTQSARFLAQGAIRVADARDAEQAFFTWAVEQDAARWLPYLDAFAQAVLPPEDFWRRRWLRLAPRYLGRMARRQHGVAFTEDEYARFQATVASLADRERAEGNREFAVTILDRVF